MCAEPRGDETLQMEVDYEKEQVLLVTQPSKRKTKKEKERKKAQERKQKLPASHLLRWSEASSIAVSKCGMNQETGTERTCVPQFFSGQASTHQPLRAPEKAVRE